MSTVVVPGRVPPGRFPRWGYLDKFYTNDLMARSMGIALAIIVGLVGGWQGYGAIKRMTQHHVAGPGRKTHVKVLTAADLGIPPSLTQQEQTQVKVEVKAKPAVAMPVPVEDSKAVEQTIATTEEMAASGSNGPALTGFGNSDSLVIDSGSGMPAPDEYVAYEKAPELVSMKDPEYPDIAREAGVEGTVLVQVLVGEDGFVKLQRIVQSVSMLDDAATNAAATAVFKPALQKDKPVAVWMVIPIEFRLHN